MEAWEKSSSSFELKSKPLVGPLKEEVVKKIVSGNRILIFCDNDGTLVPIKEKPEYAFPSEETLKLLHQLSHYSFVTFTIVTGRPQSYCETYFSKHGLNIFAEHGAFFKNRSGHSVGGLQRSTSFSHPTGFLLSSKSSDLKTVALPTMESTGATE